MTPLPPFGEHTRLAERVSVADSQFAHAGEQSINFFRGGVAGTASTNESVRGQAQSFDDCQGVKVAV